MKEIKPGLGRLTSTSAASTLRSERSSMAESPRVEEAAGRVEVALKRREAETAAKNIVDALPPDQLDALAREIIKRATGDGDGDGGGPMDMMTGVETGGRERLSPALLTNREERISFYNRLFDTVDEKPHEFYDKALGFYIGAQIDDFTRYILAGSRNEVKGLKLTDKQVEDLKEDLERFETEKRTREYLHNVNAILYLPSIKLDQLADQMQQFDSSLGDAALRQPGVMEMAKIYEEELRREMSLNNGYLPPEAVTGRTETKTEQAKDPKTNELLKDKDGHPIMETIFTKVKPGLVEERTKKRFKEWVERYGLKARDEKGNTVVARTEGTKLKDWEINRTFVTSRAMMIMSERLISIAAEGKLGEGMAQFHSLFLQDVLQNYSPYVHLIAKYGITETGLAGYIHKPGEELKRIIKFGIWSPSEVEKTYDKYKDNAKAILDTTDEFFYLGRRNPNRVGDVLTWQSWRYAKDAPSAIREFLVEGRKKMADRWNKNFPGAPKAEVYEAFINQPKYDVPRGAVKKNPKDKKEQSPIEVMRKRIQEDWKSAHPGAPSVSDYESFADEYEKWIGTALRFERMRNDLDKLKPEDRSSKEFKSAESLIHRMVDLQPHKLYQVSDWIRERVNKALGFPKEKYQTEEQKEQIYRILKNISAVETTLFQERERVLDAGRSFDTVSLEEFLEKIVPDEKERLEVKEFMDAVQNDYKVHGGAYYEEFIYRRENTHGYALWGGDVPWDELRMSALGPTGGFVRRARDNKEAAAAVAKELELLGHLRDIRHPDDLLKSLREIYDIMTHYDAGKAKQNIADKAEGLIKFYAESTSTRIPVWGAIEKMMGKRTSFAKMVYGQNAPAWGSEEIGYLLDHMKSQNMIDKKQFEKLERIVPAGGMDIAVERGVLLGQLIALAVLLYIFQKEQKDR